eukprot:g1713.t3
MESSLKLFLFVSLVTFSTVIGASIGKLLGLVKGTVFALVAFLYFLDGVICLGGTVLANGHCDVSLFIPAQLSSQLVVNMITGYLVWGDAKYVAYPTSYLLVYALCIMGVYLNSPDAWRTESPQARGRNASRRLAGLTINPVQFELNLFRPAGAMDVLGGLTRWYSIKHSRLSKGESCSNFGENVLRLLELWRRGGAAPEAYRDQLGAVLNRGLATYRPKLNLGKGLPLAKSLGFSWMPAPYLVVANDPQIVKHILKDEFNKYSKADTTLDPFFYYFEDFLGEGIFVVKHGLGSKDGGQEWSRMRKVSAQIFTRKNFNSMMQEAKTCAVELLRFCSFEMVPNQEVTYGEKITMDIKSNGKEEFWVTVVPWAGGELAASSS